MDDDVVFQFLAQRLINESNLVNKIKVFSNGFEAIEFLKSVEGQQENLPEVILLDLAMPVLDGWGFLDEFSRLKPKLSKPITVYIVSSSIDPADIAKAKSNKYVSDFIIKPVSGAKFVELVTKI